MSQERPEIFVIDDNEINVEILVNVLRDEYSVSVALDGATALEDINAYPPDLVLLDVMMPDMDGYEVCQRLKQNPDTADIPVIFITARNEVEDEMRGFEAGAVDFITKPISPPLVRARAKNHLALRFSQQRLKDLSDKLSRYLSPQLYRSIFEGRRDVRLETTRKKLTIFFSDIAGFTANTDHMEPEDLNFVLNSYLERMSAIVLENGGTLDKFIGDAILVFFGDPESKGAREDALSCVKMAIEMQRAILDLRKEWAMQGVNIPFTVRMGIASGFCTVGNFGSKERMDYTVIGGQVNLASRLESAAEPGRILVSNETWSMVKDAIYCKKMGEISVKGFDRPIPIYEVVDLFERVKANAEEITLDTPGLTLRMDPREIAEEDKQRLFNELQLAIAYLDQ